MVLLPMVWWVLAGRRTGLGRRGWAIIGYGCLFFVLGFVISGALGISLYAAGATSGLILTLSSILVKALGQEISRFVALAFVSQIREGLDRRSAITFGLGQGGFQSLFLGLALLAQARILETATGDAVAADVQKIVATPWFEFLAGALEQGVLVVALHVGLSLIVARGVASGRFGLVLLAVVWHIGTIGIGELIKASTGSGALAIVWLAIAAVGAIAYGVMRGTSSFAPVDDAGTVTSRAESIEPATGRS